MEEEIKALEIYVNKCIDLVNKGLLDEKIFRNEFSRRMKKISELGGRKLVDLYRSYKQAMKGTKSRIGNLASFTRGKNRNVIKLPRIGRRSINLRKSQNIVKSYFKW